MNFAEMFDGIAKEPKKVFENVPLPEGDYVAEVLSVTLGETKSHEKAMFKWDLKIVEGEHKNSHIFINRPFNNKIDIETEQNQKAIARALNDFKALDLPCDSKVISDTMKYLVGKRVEINLKDDGRGQGGQWQNFRRIIEPSPDDATSFGTVVPDENVPF